MADKGKEIVDEVYGFIKVYSDGTVERPHFPGGYLPASSHFVRGIASKDVTIDPDKGIWARLFLPQSVAASSQTCPVVLHFHGGGFCTGTPAAASFHRFCSKMALKSQSIWVSVDYRLAPENRLPAAYDDAYSAFLWLCAQSYMQTKRASSDQEVQGKSKEEDDSRVVASEIGSCGRPITGHAVRPVMFASYQKGSVHSSHGHDTNWRSIDAHISTENSNMSGCEDMPEPWLCSHADFSKCFLAGESAGGTIVHYLAPRIWDMKHNLVQVRGLLMIHAALFIDGTYDVSYDDPRFERRPDTYRWLSLPVGAAEWDHPLINPLHVHAPGINGIPFPPALVAVASQDKFCTPGKHYVHAMKQYGQVAELHITEGQGHCFYMYDPRCKETEELLKHLADFMLQQCMRASCKSSL